MLFPPSTAETLLTPHGFWPYTPAVHRPYTCRTLWYTGQKSGSLLVSAVSAETVGYSSWCCTDRDRFATRGTLLIMDSSWFHLPRSGWLALAVLGSRKRITKNDASTRPLHDGSQRWDITGISHLPCQDGYTDRYCTPPVPSGYAYRPYTWGTPSSRGVPVPYPCRTRAVLYPPYTVRPPVAEQRPASSVTCDPCVLARGTSTMSATVPYSYV